MKIWLEAYEGTPTGCVEFLLWINRAPDWSEEYGHWIGAHSRWVCRNTVRFILGPDFDYPAVGELVELEIKHTETWEMR